MAGGPTPSTASDLCRDIPNVEGFSPRNPKYMGAFAQAWPEEPIVQQLVAQIPWGHNVRLLDMVRSPAKRPRRSIEVTEDRWTTCSTRSKAIAAGLGLVRDDLAVPHSAQRNLADDIAGEESNNA